MTCKTSACNWSVPGSLLQDVGRGPEPARKTSAQPTSAPNARGFATSVDGSSSHRLLCSHWSQFQWWREFRSCKRALLLPCEFVLFITATLRVNTKGSETERKTFLTRFSRGRVMLSLRGKYYTQVDTRYHQQHWCIGFV